jgi:hypothetical protein
VAEMGRLLSDAETKPITKALRDRREIIAR